MASALLRTLQFYPELVEEERTEEAEEDGEGGAAGRHEPIDCSQVFLEI